jgi:hypothetical protein
MSSLLFVANATPTDQSPFAICHSPLAAVYALRITLYDTNLFGADAPPTDQSPVAIRCRFTHYELRSGGVRYENPHRHASAQ